MMYKQICVISLIVVLLLPVALSYDNDGLAPPFGLNWTVPYVSGDWSVIGNRSMISKNRKTTATTYLDVVDVPSNITYLGCEIEIDFEIPIMSKMFTLNYQMGEQMGYGSYLFFMRTASANKTELQVRHTRVTYGGLFSTGSQLQYQAWIRTPLDQGTDYLVFNTTFEKGLLESGRIRSFLFLVYHKGYNAPNGLPAYRFQIGVVTVNMQLTEDDVEYPEYFSLADESGPLTFYKKERMYIIYENDISSDDFFTSISDIQWHGTRTWSNSKCFVDMYMRWDRMENSTLVEYADMSDWGRIPSISVLRQLLLMGARSFRRLGVFDPVADALESMSLYADNALTNVFSLAPTILGVYTIFLIGLVIQSLARLDFNILPNHFMSMFSFVWGLIRTVVNLFWSVVGALSSIPLAGWIIAGLIASAVVFGIVLQ